MPVEAGNVEARRGLITGLVSTIIPVHNRADLVIQAAESVLGQSYDRVECILVNDGSTDDTPAVLDGLAAREPERVQVIHIGNSGPGHARETGRQVARGEYIQYLDSDDLLAPDKFEAQVAALRTAPEAVLCYGLTEYHRLGEEAKRSVFAGTDKRVSRIFPAFLRRRWWGTSSPLYRRSVTDRIGPWGTMWSEEDWEYDCRIGALGKPIAYVNRLVSTQRGLVGQRLSQQGRDDVRTLASQAAARTKIYHSAKVAGVSAEQPEMTWFLRSLFMLARDCGGSGLHATAAELLDLVAGETADSGLQRQVGWYRRVAMVLGWARCSQASRLLERSRLPARRAGVRGGR